MVRTDDYNPNNNAFTSGERCPALEASGKRDRLGPNDALRLMSKTKHYYNPTTCSYERVESTWVDWGTYAGSIFGIAVLLVGLSVWMLDVYAIATPEERSLRAENRVLARQLERSNEEVDRLSRQITMLAERDRTLYRRLLQIDPPFKDVQQVRGDGSDPHSRPRRENESVSSLLQRTARKLDELKRQVRLRKASYRELMKATEHRSRRLGQLPAIRPANGPIVSGYGMRDHPVLKRSKKHEGVDFSLRKGTPVMAAGNGTVDRATYSANYGRFVSIRHPESGHRTLYAHLSEAAQNIRPGANVARGDTIGYSGNTGRTTGPHLHYEVQTLNGKKLDPLQFFVPDMTPDAYLALEDRVQGYRAQFTETDLPTTEVVDVEQSSRD